MLQWFAVQTNPQCEVRAHDGLEARGYTVFLPLETRWKRARRTKVRERVSKPLLTGYLFVGLAPGQCLYGVRLQDGVRGVVTGCDGRPLEFGWRARVDAHGRVMRDAKGEVIRYHPINELQARQAAGEFDHTPAVRCHLQKGDKAKVLLEGPYKGLVGQVLAATEEGRVELLLSAALNWKTTIDSDHLEEVREAA